MTKIKVNVNTIISLFTVSIVFILTYVFAGELAVSFKRRDSCSIKAVEIILNCTARSQFECIVCATSSGHITSSWNAASNMCSISDIDTTHDNWLRKCDWIIGWSTHTKKRYTVFHVHGQNGRYSLTFQEAESLCQQRGTTLASSSDIISAKELGFELCLCGWLSNGSIGFVLQTFTDWCWSSNAEGINYCSSYTTADAYCLMK